MSKRTIEWKADVVTTTNATPTLAANASYTTPGNSATAVFLRVKVRNATTGAAYLWEGYAGFNTNLGPTVSLSSGGVTNTASQGDFTVTIDFSLSGAAIQPRITGIAATNLESTFSAVYWVN